MCELLGMSANVPTDVCFSFSGLIRRSGATGPHKDGLGICNILLSDGSRLYAYCSTTLSFITRKAPFGQATLIDKDLQVDFQNVTSSKDVVTVIATKPLTSNEHWDLISPGELKVFHDGQLI